MPVEVDAVGDVDQRATADDVLLPARLPEEPESLLELDDLIGAGKSVGCPFRQGAADQPVDDHQPDEESPPRRGRGATREGLF